MGTISFLLPENLPAEDAAQLDRACIAGGPDNVPWPGETRALDSQITIRRGVDESGYLLAPVQLGPLGRLMVSSATLMERPRPYELMVELARGKINQVRTQFHDWLTMGLQPSPELEQTIRDASRAFGQAVLEESPAARQQLAQAA